MGDQFNTTQPIYLQLVQRICRQIVREEIKAGEKLPSVRDMAVISGVNPNTVQRTYAELERLEIVETRRGLGTFITENTAGLQNLRKELMETQISNFVKDMREMGFLAEEIVDGVSEFLKQQ